MTADAEIHERGAAIVAATVRYLAHHNQPTDIAPGLTAAVLREAAEQTTGAETAWLLEDWADAIDPRPEAEQESP